jgi:hypothetical protein
MPRELYTIGCRFSLVIFGFVECQVNGGDYRGDYAEENYYYDKQYQKL